MSAICDANLSKPTFAGARATRMRKQVVEMVALAPDVIRTTQTGHDDYHG